MTAPVLDIRELSVAFNTPDGELLALDNVDLHVERGEIVGLVGETGSGKSTLAGAIFGTLPSRQATIKSGSAIVDGADMLAGEEIARHARGRHITLVPQDTFGSLNPLFRIRTQTVDLIRSTSGRRSRWWAWLKRNEHEGEILEMLDAVQLPKGRQILDQYPHQLSGGQRQRVLLALALLPRPQVVVADEPTSALDATTQIEILKLLRQVASERNIGILFTTHSLASAWEICDRIVVMHTGRIIEVADRDAFFYTPLHPYTYTLLLNATDPFNALGEINADGGKRSRIPKGCQFSRKCTNAISECAELMPSLTAHRPGHYVACYNPSTNRAPLAYD